MFSINMLSLFTFILVLGIVVDDAIIVGENVFLWRERGLSPKDAAIKGASQVAVPVTFAVLTTMATFSPMLSVSGNIGQIWRIIPLVTIIVLIFSLIESLTILPAHLGHISLDKKSRFSWVNSLGSRWERFQDKVKNALNSFVLNRYKPFLEKTIKHYKVTLASAVGLFVLTIGLLAGGWMKFIFFPALEADLVNATVAFPEGSPISQSQEAVNILHKSAEKLRAELADEYPNEAIFANVISTAGDQPIKKEAAQDSGPGGSGSTSNGSHLAEYAIELSPGEVRPISAVEIAQRWRKLTDPIFGAKELVFTTDLFSAGDAINLQLTSRSLKDLNTVSSLVKEKTINVSWCYRYQRFLFCW